MEMEIENELLLEYIDFIKNNVSYSVKILPKTPQSLASFPTIIFKESNNTSSDTNEALNGLEYVDNLTYTVDIYTKDIQVNNAIVNSRQVMQQLKQLTFNFFRDCGFSRTSCDRGEYADFTVDRLVIIVQGKLNNWNKKII